MRTIKEFVIYERQTLIDALTKIDQNKESFVIAIDNEGTLVGTLTDGDIRKALIRGVSVNGLVESACNKECKWLSIYDTLEKAVTTFRSERYEFLPIIDQQMKVINVLTKKVWHALLLSDIKFELSVDFINLNNSNILDHEIYYRPWGLYNTTFLSKFVQAKIIRIEPTAQISLQKHKYRDEHWVVIKGKGLVQLEEHRRDIFAGEYVFIPKGCKHRVKNLSDEEYLYISEIQLGNYFGEDDIIRYEDLYGRNQIRDCNKYINGGSESIDSNLK